MSRGKAKLLREQVAGATGGDFAPLFAGSPLATCSRRALRLLHDDEVPESVFLLVSPELGGRANELELAIVEAGARPRWVSSPLAMLAAARHEGRSHGLLIVSKAIPLRAPLPPGFRAIVAPPGNRRGRRAIPDGVDLGFEIRRAELEGLWHRHSTGGAGQAKIEANTAPLPHRETIELIHTAMSRVAALARTSTFNRILVALVEGPSGSGKESVAQLLCCTWRDTRTQANLTAGRHVAASVAESRGEMALAGISGIADRAASLVNPQSGYFRYAGSGGTVHIDEVAKAEHSTQTAMLRLLSTGISTAIGEGTRPDQHVDLNPMLVVLTSASEPDQSPFGIVRDLRSRASEISFQLPSLNDIDDDKAIEEVVRWLAARNGVAYLTMAAIRSLQTHRRREMRGLASAVRQAAENAKERVAASRCPRFHMHSCDVPALPPDPQAPPRRGPNARLPKPLELVRGILTTQSTSHAKIAWEEVLASYSDQGEKGVLSALRTNFPDLESGVFEQLCKLPASKLTQQRLADLYGEPVSWVRGREGDYGISRRPRATRPTKGTPQ